MTTFYLYTCYQDPITYNIHNQGTDFYKIDCDRDEFVNQIVDDKYQDNPFGYSMEFEGKVCSKYWENASGFHTESLAKYFISGDRLKKEFVKQICDRLGIYTDFLLTGHGAGIFVLDENSPGYDGDYETMDNFVFMA